jgi:hypothetical protein
MNILLMIGTLKTIKFRNKYFAGDVGYLISGIKAKESKVGILTDAKTYQYNYWF